MNSKRTPSIEIKLAPSDWIEFELACRVNGKNRPEMARIAIQWFLKNQERIDEEQKESIIEQRLKKTEDRIAAMIAKSSIDHDKRLEAMTNRFAKLMSRTAIDVGSTFMVLYSLLDKDMRAERAAWANKSSVDRLKKKLGGPEGDLKDLIKTIDSQAKLDREARADGKSASDAKAASDGKVA